MILFKYFISVVLLAILSHASASAFEVKGLKTPESFIVDPETGMYYISNIDGKPLEKDNNGFISKLDASGKPVDLHFIDGKKAGMQLNAPKGLVIKGKELYVTDIDVVHYFDKESGKHLGTIDFSLLKAKFLNDPAVDDAGRIYVSDMLGNVIYRIDPQKNFQVSILAQGTALGQPNGLLYDKKNKRLIVVTWETGKVLSVGMDGKIGDLFHDARFKNLDGVDFDKEGNIIVSSFTGGQIYRIKRFTAVEVIKEGLVTPADVSFDAKNNQVLMPSFDGNQAFTVPVK